MKPRSIPFRRFFAPEFAIDLGTARTLICLPGEGVVLEEPSLVAVQHGSRRVLSQGQAVGNLARVMLGRTPDSIQTIRPMRDGVVADFELCEVMLRYFMRKVRPRGWLFKPRVLVAVPGGMTPVEHQAVLTTVARAGAGQVHLMDKAKLAGLGAALPLAEPVASMICDVGGGTTEIAVLCLGDVAVGESIRAAGEELNQAIVDYLRRQHRLRIGEQMAERIKLEIGSAAPLAQELSLEVGGCDVVAGLPRKISLSSEEVREAMQNPLRMIVEAVERTLERCQPELSAELMETGMVLAGGSARLRGLDSRLAGTVGMPVRVAEEPANCVARGLSICLEHREVWQMLSSGRQAA